MANAAITKLDDRSQCLAGNTVQIQTDTAESLRLDHSDTSADLGSSDNHDIPNGSGTQNGHAGLMGHMKASAEGSGRGAKKDVSRLNLRLASTFLSGEEPLVLLRSHQLVNFSGIGKFDDNHPPFAVRVTVDDFRMVLQICIYLGDGTA